ncbi:hypothetical protein JW721_01425 [Candidatus Micrarchaeota archaeon]|nr:hypothetical protein [Candidatus Micrarchaeota archaeon]
MAQKKLEKKENALAQVPSKIGFLDSIGMELTFAGYENVGYVAGGSVDATYGPLTLGVGAGAEKLDYYGKALPYVTPKLEVRGVLGDFELYAVAAAPIIPKTGETRISATTYGTAGAVWEPLPGAEGGGMTLRIGAELKHVAEWGRTMTQYLTTAGFGAAIGRGPITVYATETILFHNKRPYEQAFEDHTRPHQNEIAGGVSLGLEGVEIRGEVSHSRLEKGARLSFSFRSANLAPKIYGWYSKEDESLGGADKAGVGLNMELGRGALKAKARVEGGAGLERGDGKAEEWEKGGGEWIFQGAMGRSENISEFAKKYEGVTAEGILYAAARLGEYGYGNYGDVSDSHTRKMGVDGEFRSIRKSVISGEEGVGGLCSNIGSLQATFLREVGWEAYSGSVVGGKYSHSIAFAKDPETGTVYFFQGPYVSMNPRGSVLPLLRKYAKEKGLVPQRIYLYGEGNRIIGHYELEEGKLNRAMAEDEDTLKDALLHSRPKKRK